MGLTLAKTVARALRPLSLAHTRMVQAGVLHRCIFPGRRGPALLSFRDWYARYLDVITSFIFDMRGLREALGQIDSYISLSRQFVPFPRSRVPPRSFLLSADSVLIPT